MKHNLVLTSIFSVFMLAASPFTFANLGLQKKVETVDYVDLNRYIGKWYEIASIPQSFQKKCIGNVTAEYAFAEKNRIQVINGCDTNDGKTLTEGRAKVIDKTSNAKLKVTFVKAIGWVFAFGGDYWIIDLGDNYDYAVIGHPTRDYGWILSRTPYLPENQLAKAKAVLTANGYNLCNFITTIQDNGNQSKNSLCE